MDLMAVRLMVVGNVHGRRKKMTRDEAIAELSVLHERFNSGMGWRDGNYTEALDMAIEALSASEDSKEQKSKLDLISRADLLKQLDKRYCEPCQIRNDDCNGAKCRACWIDDCVGEIADAPSVSAEPKRGKWIFDTEIPIGNGRTSAGYKCSNCCKDYWNPTEFSYCPNCGAKMGVSEHNDD